MKRGQRIDIIKKICQALLAREMPESDMILRTFECKTWDAFNTSLHEYYSGLVEGLDSGKLVELHEYLYPGEELPVIAATNNGSFWKKDFVKLFISHSTKQKLFAAQIKSEAAEFGIDCFVAHEDIVISTDWIRELRYGLTTCDCIVALLTEDFQNSEFCDQEIGFALQRSALIVPVRINVKPYGFMAQYQGIKAANKTPKQVLMEIQSLISTHDSLASVAQKGLLASQEELVKKFLASSNFGDSSALLANIELLQVIPKPLLKELYENWKENDQIAGCNKIPARMDYLFKKHQYKPKARVNESDLEIPF